VLEQGEGALSPDGELKLAHLFGAESPEDECVAEAEVTDASGRVERAAAAFRVLGPKLRLELENESDLPLVALAGEAVVVRLRATDRDGVAARDVAVLVSCVTTRGAVSKTTFAREKPTERDGRVEIEVPWKEPGLATYGFAVRDAS